MDNSEQVLDMSFQSKVTEGVASGVRKGWFGFVWMIKILIPVSFLTMLLNYSGWLTRIDFILNPIMGLIGLPSVAALPLIAGMLTGIYGGIAALIMLPLTQAHMTMIAVFLLISHNMIQEGIIQNQSGMNLFTATAIRLITSVLTVMAIAPFLNSDPTDPAAIAIGAGLSPQVPFLEMVNSWGVQTLLLSIKIFAIIMLLMILMGFLKSFNLIPKIVTIIRPLLRIMGLDERVGILWLTAVVFGLAYGAAVILEESKEGKLQPEELTRLHLSVGINHSMVEDPSLFLSLGLSPFWLWIPRLMAAIFAVRCYNLWQRRAGSTPIEISECPVPMLVSRDVPSINQQPMNKPS